MIRIRSFAIAIAAIFALGLAPLAHAQTIKDTTETGAVTGDITALDVAAGTHHRQGPERRRRHLQGRPVHRHHERSPEGRAQGPQEGLAGGGQLRHRQQQVKIAKLIEVVVAP